MTRIELFNQVLIALGFARRDDPDDGSEEFLILNELYPLVRDEILRRPWSCAVRRMEVHELADPDPLARWKHVYQLPVDPKCLEILELLFEDNEPVDVRYEVEGDKLYVDEPVKAVRYVAQIDVWDMDPHVAHLMMVRLTMRATFPLKGDQRRTMMLREEWEQAFAEANQKEIRVRGPGFTGDKPRSKIMSGTSSKRYHRSS